MGNWNISIRGVGVHHNNPPLPDDANVMAKKFVDELKAQGHNVTSAEITYGGAENLAPSTDDKPGKAG